MKKPSKPRGRKPAPSMHSLGDAEFGETKTKILDAAFRRLVDQGYAALSVREIAKDAGVNHALINYHFRTKDQLVIAVLEGANRRLLARQEKMYRGPSSFAEKWTQARRFYEDDLASGFVRVQAELFAASLSNPSLREKFQPQIAAWREVVRSGVRDALRALEATGTSLPSPLNANALACWIASFWLGMEFSDLLGQTPASGDHVAALDAMQTLLEHLDARIEQAARMPYTKRVAANTKSSNRKRA